MNNNVMENFELKEIIHNEENSIIMLGNDRTCIKRVDLPKCVLRLKNEYNCLIKIGDKPFVPRLFGYDEQQNVLRMEFIDGLTINKYVNKYGKIPDNYMKAIVSILLDLLDFGVEYGGDMKFGEHFIIENDTNQIRVIDFGISNIINRVESIELWKETYKVEYAFVFEKTKNDVKSKEGFTRTMLLLGIDRDIIEKYFSDMDHII